MQKALKWSQSFDEMVFLESNKNLQTIKQKYGEFDAVLAVGAEKSLAIDSQNSFDQLKEFQSQHKDFLFGYLSYDLKNDIEELSSSNADYLNFLNCFFSNLKKFLYGKKTPFRCYISGLMRMKCIMILKK